MTIADIERDRATEELLSPLAESNPSCSSGEVGTNSVVETASALGSSDDIVGSPVATSMATMVSELEGCSFETAGEMVVGSLVTATSSLEREGDGATAGSSASVAISIAAFGAPTDGSDSTVGGVTTSVVGWDTAMVGVATTVGEGVPAAKMLSDISIDEDCGPFVISTATGAGTGATLLPMVVVDWIVLFVFDIVGSRVDAVTPSPPAAGWIVSFFFVDVGSRVDAVTPSPPAAGWIVSFFFVDVGSRVDVVTPPPPAAGWIVSFFVDVVGSRVVDAVPPSL